MPPQQDSIALCVSPRARPTSADADRKGRRISRACDPCHAQRIRCDGRAPCMRCFDTGANCGYKRAFKKRGKLPQLATHHAQRSKAEAHAPSPGPSIDAQLQARTFSSDRSGSSLSSIRSPDPEPEGNPYLHLPLHPAPQYAGGDSDVNFESCHFRSPTASRQAAAAEDAFTQEATDSFYPGSSHDSSSGVTKVQPAQNEDRSRGSCHQYPVVQTSPPNIVRDEQLKQVKITKLRYPVLLPVLPYISSIVPVTVACDLMELYCTSVTSANLRPSSPFILAYVFRKSSILHPTHPRICSAALLASMLWLAAQTSDAYFLRASVAARGKVCQKLLELTVNLLKPLVHQSNNEVNHSGPTVNGIALGGFGVNRDPPVANGNETGDSARLNSQYRSEVDDIVTYMHLATVISASEYKATSVRWWSVVWSLVRELRFNREIPAPFDAVDHCCAHISPNISVSEETREERRRVWWLAYTVDRHLSLCYNQPLSLTDAECMDIFRPVTEKHWQSGEFYFGPPNRSFPRLRGPGFECMDHGIFGFFTPLMTILGECIDLQQLRYHPRFGNSADTSNVWLEFVAQVRQHLDIYRRSLQAFRSLHHLDNTTISAPPGLDELQMQTVVILAYADYLLHVMHILLEGKWDPMNLLDEAWSWLSSEAFSNANDHAIEAAEALSLILDYDPDLSVMPWFFGIYLLQGSFILLLFTDKLGADTSKKYVSACEQCVRAIEACVATLSTEYQRNFRNILRTALTQTRRLATFDAREVQQRRKEVLSLYRWIGSGTGLAL